MDSARSKLNQMLEKHELTRGMYVRVHGDHLIAGREESVGPEGEIEKDDRVRFTRLGTNTYGLSVKRHTGRWEPTPFSGSMSDMVDAVLGFMQHFVARY